MGDSLPDDVWLDVLKLCCQGEVLDTFNSLPSRKAKDDMLHVLKGSVTNKLMWGNHGMGMFNNQFALPKGKSENAISRALKHHGATASLINYDGVLATLHRWGVKQSNDEILRHQEAACKEAKSNESDQQSGFGNLSTNTTVTKCGQKSKILENLKQIYITDLQLFESSKGCYIEGSLVGFPRAMVGVIMLLKDKKGDLVFVNVYNAIPSGPQILAHAERMFPENLKLKIIEPYMKIYGDGTRGLRIDNPKDIVFVSRDNNQVDIEDIRKEGKELMKNENYLLALDIYYMGLTRYTNTIFPLLLKRSKNNLEHCRYEEALFDAAAALFLKVDNEVANTYLDAFHNLFPSSEGVDSSQLLWAKLLEKDIATNQSLQEGNLCNKDFDFEISNICLLLTNISIVCTKLCMLQTAIAAASASLRLSIQKKEKAYYCISKAFIMLGEPELYRSVCSYVQNREQLNKYLDSHKNTSIYFQEMFRKFQFDDYHGNGSEFLDHDSTNIIGDYIVEDTLKNVYIESKGRGIVTLRDIRQGEVLLVDHPILGHGGFRDSSNPILVSSVNTKLKSASFAGHVNLTTKLMKLIGYNGLLSRKLSCLVTGIPGQSLPLIDDLKGFTQHTLSKLVPPFLSQTNEVIDSYASLLSFGQGDVLHNESQIEGLISINTFEAVDKDSKGYENISLARASALFLRSSLFNHSSDFNCVRILFGNVMVVFARKPIPKDTELTVHYGDEYCKSSKGKGFLP